MKIIRKHPWISIFLAIAFEDGWVVGIKYSTSILDWILTLIALTVSMILFMEASEVLPVGTVYTTFVGLGSAATVITGWIFFNNSLTIPETIFLIILVVGVMGLKNTTKEN